MGAQIAVSLAVGGLEVQLWGRREASLGDAAQRIDAALAHMAENGLISRDEVKTARARISLVPDLEEAVRDVGFAIEAIVEDLEQKRTLLRRIEAEADSYTILSSTTSALSATALQEPLVYPDRFVVAHYAQPAHLVKLVEIVPGTATAPETTVAVVDLLSRTGKTPVTCPDIPGFLWARIQHAVLRELVSLIDRGLVDPEECDKVLKEGYAVRLPAMGSFEHADLAGLDLIDSDSSRAVWADLSNVTSPAETSIGRLRREGKLGMKSGSGFYDWNKRDPEEFKRNRDAEIVRRMLIQAGGRVTPV